MAGSEDLEQSLRAEVENYIRARVQGHQEEIARVQSQVNEAFTRLNEQLSDASMTDASLAVSISEHLRAATGKGTEVAAQSSARARATSDIALLKAAVEDIDNQRSQADILNTLVNRAAAFSPRLAFFVVKNERATGWRARGLEGTVGDDAVREISLPLTADTLLSRAASSRSTWSGAPGTNADDHQLISKLGDDEAPERMVAIPLVARDKCVAVLYADSAALEPESINLEALETLVRVTSMAVELLALKRPAARPSERLQAAQPFASAGGGARTTQTPAAAGTGTPSGSGASTGHIFEPTPTPPPSPTPAPQAAHEPTLVAEPHEERGIEPSYAVDARPPAAPETPALGERSAPAQVSVEQSPAVSATPTAAPLGGSSRRADAELPVEVSDEEKRYHNDARRFARLLVSEIKLYNEQKVRDGREQGNLYERLREEIDRSRQMYDKRVAPNVASRYDYFHHELVNTLAEGNAAKLGGDYPGAQAVM